MKNNFAIGLMVLILTGCTGGGGSNGGGGQPNPPPVKSNWIQISGDVSISPYGIAYSSFNKHLYIENSTNSLCIINTSLNNSDQGCSDLIMFPDDMILDGIAIDDQNNIYGNMITNGIYQFSNNNWLPIGKSPDNLNLISIISNIGVVINNNYYFIGSSFPNRYLCSVANNQAQSIPYNCIIINFLKSTDTIVDMAVDSQNNLYFGINMSNDKGSIGEIYKSDINLSNSKLLTTFTNMTFSTGSVYMTIVKNKLFFTGSNIHADWGNLYYFDLVNGGEPVVMQGVDLTTAPNFKGYAVFGLASNGIDTLYAGFLDDRKPNPANNVFEFYKQTIN